MKKVVGGRPDRRQVAVLLLILVVGGALRFSGIDFGLPYLWHPDEPAVFNYGLRMLQDGDLNPHRFNYPTLYIYMEAARAALGYLALVGQRGMFPLQSIPNGFDTGMLHTIGEPSLWLAGRRLTAMLGILAIAATWDCGRRSMGSLAAAAAAWVVATCAMHVHNSRFITTDVPVSMAVAVVLWLSARIAREPRAHLFLLAGAGAGVAAAFKYNGIMVLVAPLSAWATSRERGATAGWAIAMFPAAILVFFCCVPYAILDIPQFLSSVAQETAHYLVRGHPNATVAPGWPHAALVFRQLAWKQFPVWGILALVGAGLAVFRRDRAVVPPLVFLVAYGWLIARTRISFARNLVPLVPAMGLLAGSGAAALARLAREHLSGRSVQVAMGALVIAVVAPAWPTAAKAYDLARQVDSRVRFTRWLHESSPKGARIAVPRELRLDPASLEGLDTIGVSLIDETPSTWRERGATHVIGGPELVADARGLGGITPAALKPVADWFAGREPVKLFGWSRWPINTNAQAPKIGLYHLDVDLPSTWSTLEDAPPPTDEGDTEAVWKAVPKSEAGRSVRFEDGRIVLEARTDGVTLVCSRNGWPVTRAVQVAGRWKAEELSGTSAVLQARFFDASGDLIQGRGSSHGIQAFAGGLGSTGWQDFNVQVHAPPRSAEVRLCGELRGEQGLFRLDDVRIVATDGEPVQWPPGAERAARQR